MRWRASSTTNETWNMELAAPLAFSKGTSPAPVLNWYPLSFIFGVLI